MRILFHAEFSYPIAVILACMKHHNRYSYAIEENMHKRNDSYVSPYQGSSYSVEVMNLPVTSAQG